MNELIKAIRDAIIANTTLDYLESRVYISSLDLFPESYACPCVILSDAGESIEWFPNTTKDSVLSVMISSFVYYREPETALIGVGSKKGVLDITADLQTLLVHNLLSLSGYIDAFVKEVGRSGTFEIESQQEITISQSMIMQYRRDG